MSGPSDNRDCTSVLRAITLRHPWPLAFTRFGKDIENRTWVPGFGQLRPGEQLALHAGKAPRITDDSGDEDYLEEIQGSLRWMKSGVVSAEQLDGLRREGIALVRISQALRKVPAEKRARILRAAWALYGFDETEEGMNTKKRKHRSSAPKPWIDALKPLDHEVKKRVHLLPCPFCGGAVALKHLPQEASWSEEWRIEHDTGRCAFVRVSRDTEAEAVTTWNVRAAPARNRVDMACDLIRYWLGDEKLAGLAETVRGILTSEAKP